MKNKDVSKSSKKEKKNYLTAVKDLEQKIENMFQDLWQNTLHHENVPDPFSFGSLGNMPKIDVVERKKDVLVKAELPGFNKKEIGRASCRERV